MARGGARRWLHGLRRDATQNWLIIKNGYHAMGFSRDVWEEHPHVQPPLGPAMPSGLTRLPTSAIVPKSDHSLVVASCKFGGKPRRLSPEDLFVSQSKRSVNFRNIHLSDIQVCHSKVRKAAGAPQHSHRFSWVFKDVLKIDSSEELVG
jgi:hypothetical protein